MFKVKQNLFKLVKEQVQPSQVALRYLGQPTKEVGNSLVYYSPLRKKERTPSFFVDDEKGIHDFRNV